MIERFQGFPPALLRPARPQHSGEPLDLALREHLAQAGQLPPLKSSFFTSQSKTGLPSFLFTSLCSSHTYFARLSRELTRASVGGFAASDFAKSSRQSRHGYRRESEDSRPEAASRCAGEGAAGAGRQCCLVIQVTALCACFRAGCVIFASMCYYI